MSRPLRVLIVEDLPEDAELILRELARGGFEPAWKRVETAVEMQAALGEGPWDIVLSDNQLPGFGVAEALGLAKQADPDLPFVVVSGTIGEQAAVELMRAGAGDCILKGSLLRLASAVDRGLSEAKNRRDRKQAETQRDRLMGRLRLQIERMPMAYVLTNADFLVIDWNGAAERIFGYSKEEMLGEGPPFAKIVPASARSELEEIFRRVRAGDMAAHSVPEMLTKDGRTITCEWYNTPLMTDGGAFLGMISLAQDVTARRRAEEALLLRDRAIQAVTQGILITDSGQPDNPIVYASPGFSRLTGYAAEEVVGRDCRFLQGKDTDPASVALVREAVREGRPCMVEMLNYRKDGTSFWNELSIAPIKDSSGRSTHSVGVQTDVTQRRRLEEQYRQAQRMEAVGQLAGGVAHDFNNLLTVIGGYTDLLLQMLDADDPKRALLEEIQKAQERSAALTRQLLAFSRKQVLAPKVLDLNEVVRGTEKMLCRLIGEDVRLATVLSSRLHSVKADPGQIEQVLLNLAVNARDAMPQGGRLTIETGNIEAGEDHVLLHPGSRPGSYVLLSVSDSGVGMTEEVREHIFEPFFTTKGPGKGTGLGLAVVHGIVEQSGGHMEVSSEPGAGTTFKIYLPRVQEPAPGAISRSAPRSLLHGSETLLLVEDDEALRALTGRVLGDWGYVVMQAADGLAALRLAEEHKPPIHLLLTDVVMPGLGGRQLAERLEELHPETKVLYLSGYTDDAVVRHGIFDAQFAFLQKPYSPRALAAKIRQVLEQS